MGCRSRITWKIVASKDSQTTTLASNNRFIRQLHRPRPKLQRSIGATCTKDLNLWKARLEGLVVGKIRVLRSKLQIQISCLRSPNPLHRKRKKTSLTCIIFPMPSNKARKLSNLKRSSPPHPQKSPGPSPKESDTLKSTSPLSLSSLISSNSIVRQIAKSRIKTRWLSTQCSPQLMSIVARPPTSTSQTQELLMKTSDQAGSITRWWSSSIAPSSRSKNQSMLVKSWSKMKCWSRHKRCSRNQLPSSPSLAPSMKTTARSYTKGTMVSWKESNQLVIAPLTTINDDWVISNDLILQNLEKNSNIYTK